METSLGLGIWGRKGAVTSVGWGWGPGLHSESKEGWLGEGSELVCTTQEASMRVWCVNGPDILGKCTLLMP
jgi:hypothetical protein